MKSAKSMTYKELEQELLRNRNALRSASLEQKRKPRTEAQPHQPRPRFDG